MFKLLSAFSTVESAHQKALATRNTWLEERVRASESTGLYKWNVFKQHHITPSERAITPPRSQLLSDLAELAEGTTIMGRPERTPPKFGPIESPESASTRKKVQEQVYDPPSPTPGAEQNHTEIVATVPVTTIPSLHRTFEIRTSMTILSEPLSAFYESFEESENRSDFSDIPTDENAPPSHLFEEPLPMSTDVEILKPQLRGPRQPFAVLHFDLEGAPSENDDAQGLIMSADDLESTKRNCEVVGVFYEGVTVTSGYHLKSWDRLRSNAPRVVNLDAEPKDDERKGLRDLQCGEKHTASESIRPAEDPEAPPAPKMTSVPLPPEISLPYASLSLDDHFEEVTTLVPHEKLSSQMMPCPESPFAILNEG
ncbi:hypothetical protein BDZ94DRAFT_1254641 [Collybia nuda]|uniref:Uncharacterized protein n=1 Tax=Collybia nuda TaxID=64659 RepID=A0A9P6CGJ7_9AGAR|nr:hypothetical protein BDZ94DRAFT_1254641 [Collybia nuda]